MATSRIWRAFGLQPHRTEAFKLSSDPQFIDKVRDVRVRFGHSLIEALPLQDVRFQFGPVEPATRNMSASGFPGTTA